MSISRAAFVEHVIAGEYHQVLAAYQSEANLSPEDHRWLGWCQLLQNQPLEAAESLMRARARGCAAASIELASLHRHLGQYDLARQAIEDFDTSAADHFDRALAERERGALEYTLGHLDAAIKAFETALQHAARDELAARFEPAIHFVLAIALADKGQSERALKHLDNAMASSHGDKHLRQLAARAECLIALGRLSDAQRDIQEAEALAKTQPLSVPVLHYVRGVLERAAGRADEAAAHLQESARQAQAASALETELYARAELGAVHTQQKQFTEARAQLARARSISNCDKTDAIVAWRTGSLKAQKREADAIGTLERALAQFERLRLERESGWVRLHLAEAHALAGNTQDAEVYLNAATDSRHALGAGSGLFIELRSLPKVLEMLHGLPATAYAHILLHDLQHARGNVPVTVELDCMGGAKLLADRKKIKLNAGLPVTVELLAFLLLHPGSTLERILGEVAFPDAAPERAKSYFHLVRNEIKNALPGCSIPYDNDNRTYTVDFGGVNATVDFLEIKKALATPSETGLLRALTLYKGAFLPYSESDWVQQEREQIEWALVNTALRVLETLYAAGSFERCVGLAERVLELTPTDIAMGICLVRAVRAAHGVLAGREAFERMQQRFIGELGEVPPAFLESIEVAAILT